MAERNEWSACPNSFHSYIRCTLVYLDKPWIYGRIQVSTTQFSTRKLKRKELMVTKHLWQWLAAIALIGLLLFGSILAACNTAAEPGAGAPSATEQMDEAASTAADEAEAAQEAEATEEVEATEAAQDPEATTEVAQQPAAPAVSPPAVCQAIPIPINESIPAVSEDDWALGPATAAVTVIEYGDFQ
jgi:hypothetical protein